MIIIDGPDGAGKSTLCGMLKQQGVVNEVLPSPRLVAKGNPERMKYEVDRYIRLHGTNNKIAVDRMMFSEMVYGPVLRGSSVYSRAEYLAKLLEIMLSGSIAIFCLPDKLNFKPEESPLLIEKMPKIVELYKTVAEDSAFSNSKTYIYKWDEPKAFQQLKRFIEENS